MSTTEIETEETLVPLYVALEVTRACNLACLHCGSSCGPGKQTGELTLAEWQETIKKLVQLGTQEIFLSGGEPLVHPNWKEIVSSIRTIGLGRVRASMVTNGMLLDQSACDFLVESGFGTVAISLDGSPDTHNFIRQNPNSHQRVLEAIQLCRVNGLYTTVITAINQHNFDERNAILAQVLATGANSWQVQVVNSFGRAGADNDTMLATKAQFVTLIDDLARWKKTYEGRLVISAADSLGYCHPRTDELLGEDYEWCGCNAGLYVLGISANGDVKGCLSLQSDEFSAGNVRTTDLLSIWREDRNFPYTRGFEISHLTGHCRTCASGSQCKAGCLAMASSIGGTTAVNPYCYRHLTKEA